MANVTRNNHMSDEVFVITRGGETQALCPHAVSVRGGRVIFVSGQLALDKDGTIVGKGDMRAQLRQVGENLRIAASLLWTRSLDIGPQGRDGEGFYG